MTKSAFSKEYEKFCQLLIETRKKKNMTQEQVATKLNRPQSFVSKYECGERRLDFIEFIEVMAALKINPLDFIKRFLDPNA